jgi:mRNA-degrading endonuclease toxin of MazEF toxin-antitoxin module
MPLSVAELRRGRIVLALFPFAAQFPVRLPRGGEIPTVEEYAALRRGSPTGVAVDARLRPVLLLHDRTRGEHGDVVCLRISSVKDAVRASPSFSRIERHEHPFFFLLASTRRRYGLLEDSVIALSSIGTVHKSALLGPRHVGELTSSEMRVISERLARILSLDLSAAVAARARELVIRVARRGGSGTG